MTLKDGNWKVALGGILGAIMSILGIIGFVNSGVDGRIENKIIKHEAEFEAEQQQTVTEIKEDIATLKARSEANQRQLNSIEAQGKHTQELVEQLIRDN